MIPASVKLGAIPSPHDPDDFAFKDSDLVAGAALGSPRSPSIVSAHAMRTQRYNDCVGYTVVQPVQDLLAVRGRPCGPLSALFPYAGSRLLQHPPAEGQALADNGCNYRNAQKWARDEGIVLEEHFPETDENVGLTPPLGVRQKARSARIKTSHRLISMGLPDFRAQLLAALALAERGDACAPGFVMLVDEAYWNAGSSVYDRAGGKPLGWHAQEILEVNTPGDYAVVAGTWGEELGDRGLYRISIPFLHVAATEVWIQEIDLASFEVAA